MKSFSTVVSTNFLLDASLLFRKSCPEMSRYLLRQHSKANESPNQSHLQNNVVCLHCYQWLEPDNHRVRLRPKLRPSVRIQSVLRRRAMGKRLSLAQNKLMQRFQRSKSVLMATCHTCNKTSRHKGMNREFIATLAKTHGTPGRAGRPKTPQSAGRSSKTPSKDKTPAHTPRSSTSSSPAAPGSSSKTPSKAKGWMGRLSKILTREEKQGSKPGSLKDFLSSL